MRTLVLLAVVAGLVVALAGCAHGLRSREALDVVPGLPPIVAIDAEGQHSLALAVDGRVFSWGDTEGGLGGPAPVADCDDRSPNGPTPCRPAPAVVPLPAPAVAISSADDHQVALTADGTVWTWGSDHDPRHADSPERCDALAYVRPPCHLTPAPVTGLPPIVSVDAGVSHVVAVDRDGRVWQWGEVPAPWATTTCSGEPSYGRDYPCSPEPVVVPGLPPVATVVTHGTISLAIDTDGRLWSWAPGTSAQLGRTAMPTRLPGPDAVATVATGRNGTAIVGRDGSVWVTGQLQGLPDGGCGRQCTLTPVQELGPGSAVSTTGPTGLRVRTADGTVLVRDREGVQAGVVGPPPSGWVPAPEFAGAVMVAHGQQHQLVLTADGRVLARGYNAYGQLGV
ncbi:RCC1 domain-containing protein [Actinomycetospora termitidis]|uniref:Uncharacterized protein n=1 Tax=Actinomycetospora termitidis TaxID=3053470 RepID=A0ABT7MEJ3_9PSEU|nr:hypothetical protein [Actinomycetospora sp. Odt1-22]MDL5158876.1 hypothetical protein [Actinomycetospora sp. Odt1-22]